MLFRSKTAVMLEAYHLSAEGKLRFDDVVTLTDAIKVGGSGVLNGLRAGLPLRIRDLVELMIVVSDNTATNMLVERLGTKRIDDRLAGLKLPDTKIFRPTFRDGRADVFPELEREFGLGMTTPRQMAELMAMIAEGRAVNPDASAAMVAPRAVEQRRRDVNRQLRPSDGQFESSRSDEFTQGVAFDPAITSRCGKLAQVALFQRLRTRSAGTRGVRRRVVHQHKLHFVS